MNWFCRPGVKGFVFAFFFFESKIPRMYHVLGLDMH